MKKFRASVGVAQGPGERHAAHRSLGMPEIPFLDLTMKSEKVSKEQGKKSQRNSITLFPLNEVAVKLRNVSLRKPSPKVAFANFQSPNFYKNARRKVIGPERLEGKEKKMPKTSRGKTGKVLNLKTRVFSFHKVKNPIAGHMDSYRASSHRIRDLSLSFKHKL
jgi:hypothetical protein